MKVLSTTIAATALLLSGCSSIDSTDAQSTSSEARTDGYRCDKVVAVGSRMPTRRCTTAAQREAERQEAERIMNTRGVSSTANN